MSDSETITIPLERYEKLVEAADWLHALEAAGLDNWDGCDVAKDILAEWEEQEG